MRGVARAASPQGVVATWARASGAVVLGVALLATALLSSCGTRKDGAPATGTVSDTASTTTTMAVDTSAVTITLVDGPGVMEGVRRNTRAVTLVNVWATWCAPCREEFPDLMRVARENESKGLSLMLVSADFEDQMSGAKSFLAKNGASFPSYLKTGDDMAFIEALSHKWSGALPATFLFDRAGHLIDFWEGRAPYDDMSRRVTHALQVAHATLPS